MHRVQAIPTPPSARLQLAARAHLPTRHGPFDIVAFEATEAGTEGEHDGAALVLGDLATGAAPLVRLHSECFTGDVMGSRRCDCGDQLDTALSTIAEEGRGAVVYLRQEGRGIGLANKIRAYALQDEGLDTVQANHALGFADDLRSYADAAEMLRLLGVSAVRLLTNNPAKVRGLRKHGIDVVEVVPLRTDPNPHNFAYLTTKKTKSGHDL